MYPALALSGLLALFADWQSASSLRSALPKDARQIAYWQRHDAAFLAASVPQKGVVSIVRVNDGKTEVVYDGQLRPPAGGTPITSLDLDGVILRNAVILFHTEPLLASSAISFDTGKVESPKLRFIVTGLAPGIWEVWRNGWVVEPEVPVRTREAVLYFEGQPGSYFIRRLQ